MKWNSLVRVTRVGSILISMSFGLILASFLLPHIPTPERTLTYPIWSKPGYADAQSLDPLIAGTEILLNVETNGSATLILINSTKNLFQFLPPVSPSIEEFVFGARLPLNSINEMIENGTFRLIEKWGIKAGENTFSIILQRDVLRPLLIFIAENPVEAHFQVKIRWKPAIFENIIRAALVLSVTGIIIATPRLILRWKRKVSMRRLFLTNFYRIALIIV